MLKRILLVGAAATLLLLPRAASTEDVVIFDHVPHAEAEMGCADCHSPEATGIPYLSLMPKQEICLDCHDEDVLPALPAKPASHAGFYRHQHQFQARGKGQDCAICHYETEDCTLCHHGENVDFLAHDRNWLYTHPITKFKGTELCENCHMTQSYCVDCHVQHGVLPGSHLVDQWTEFGGGGAHARAGREDLGNCMLCHDGLPASLCTACHPGMGQ